MYLTSKHVYIWPQHPCIQFKNVMSDIGVNLLLSAFHHKESTHVNTRKPFTFLLCGPEEPEILCVYIRVSINFCHLWIHTEVDKLMFVFDWNHSHIMTPSSFGIFSYNDHKKLPPPLLRKRFSCHSQASSLYYTIYLFPQAFSLFLPCFIWFYCKIVS